MARPAIMWFRRDLRLGDNPALVAAAEEGPVLPLFVVDPAFARSGAVRLAQLADTLAALDTDLRERAGVGLMIRHGDPRVDVPALAADVDASAVFVARDFTPYGVRRDTAVAEALDADGRALRGVGSPYVNPPGTVTKDDGTPYAVFTPFSRRWREAGWREPVESPADDVRWCEPNDVGSEPLPRRPDPGRELPPAGEEAALDRWLGFRDGDAAADDAGRTRLDAYADQRDLPGRPGTSQLSVDLKWGTIHPRTILADLDPEAPKRSGAATFASEIAWREFYADVLHHHPRSAWENLTPRFDDLPVDTGAGANEKFDRWCRGETGFGIVDAGMRQLAATGWMHNRVRMITASFLVKDLHLPWQWGARWFLENLVDGDLASNNHGWQWVAGSGTDASPFHRVFNPTTQEERFDPDGEYVSRWVADPVEPMVDHAAERKEALARLDVIRNR